MLFLHRETDTVKETHSKQHTAKDTHLVLTNLES